MRSHSRPPTARYQRGSALLRFILSKAAIAWMAGFIVSTPWAQCGITQSCLGVPPPPLLSELPPVCPPAKICFVNLAARQKYEQKNNCILMEYRCNGNEIDEHTQCCVKDVQTGKNKIRQKQYEKFDKKFNWEIYTKECKNMRQSEAAPDALWNQCTVGQKHSEDDDYPVLVVEKNGSARSYCIDGCSTPPSVVKAAAALGLFIFPDRNNPTGAGPGGIGEVSSFLPACSAHDKCYQTCNSNDQKTCDGKMLMDMQAACNRISENYITVFEGNFKEKKASTRDRCLSAARTMHAGLEKFGSDAFNRRRQQYCQCC